MSVYTVHVQETDALAWKARFIREGFSWGALIFGPIWLLTHRLWVAFLVYCLALVSIEAMVHLLHLADWTSALMGELAGLYLALEGNQLQRKALERSGWPMVDIVSGVNLEAAERLFYDRWTSQTAHLTPTQVMTSPSMPVSRYGTTTGILGLFPQKGV